MRQPSDFLPSQLARHLRGRVGLLGLALLALALGEPMRAHSDALVTLAAPHGILSLQFACSADASLRILAAWDGAALEHARLSLIWDCGFAPAYGFALAALTERLGNSVTGYGRARLTLLAWLPLWAAVADLLENLLHFRLLQGADADGMAALTPLACGFAMFKWALLATWLVTLIGLGLRAMARRATRS